MNAIVKVETGGVPALGLVPTSMGEAMQLANMMAGARLVPQALQKSPADCLMVIQQAIRWQMDPFAVAQECSVIQGKLMHSGKLVAAVVNARGNLDARLTFDYEGKGDDLTIKVSGRLAGEAEPRTVSVKLKDAKTSNKVWQAQPEQQLMYHGTRVWARRHTPELMLGVYSPEEFDEQRAQAAARAPTPAPLKLAKPEPAPPAEPEHDADTGEVIEAQAEPGPQPKKEEAADRVPTQDEYIAWWGQIIANPDATAAQIRAEWNAQKALRKQILWGDDSEYDALLARVKTAIENAS